MLTDEAPGWPGIEPRWTSSAKSGVGTTLSYRSHVWLTLSHGIFNEIYYPRLDQACVRDLGLVVTDGQDFFSEERRHAGSQISALADGVPAYRVVNACVGGRYRIEKEVLAPAVVRWSADGWLTSHDAPTRDTGLGVHVADLPADMLPAGASVCFTFFWSEAGKWEGVNFCLTVRHS